MLVSPACRLARQFTCTVALLDSQEIHVCPVGRLTNIEAIECVAQTLESVVQTVHGQCTDKSTDTYVYVDVCVCVRMRAGEGGDRRADGEGHRRDALALHPRRRQHADPLLLCGRPLQHRPHVPVLARVVHRHLPRWHRQRRARRYVTRRTLAQQVRHATRSSFTVEMWLM